MDLKPSKEGREEGGREEGREGGRKEEEGGGRREECLLEHGAEVDLKPSKEGRGGTEGERREGGREEGRKGGRGRDGRKEERRVSIGTLGRSGLETR